MKLATQLAQVGINRNDKTGTMSTPIYQTSTFRHPALGESSGFDYSRSGNPTRQALEESICLLEKGQRGLAFASGMAAISAIMSLFKAGDRLLVSDDTYGGTYRLFTTLGANNGLDFKFIDLTNLDLLASSITQSTKAVFVETPTNPLMKIVNLEALVNIAHSHGLIVIVDNTFFTPYLQQPLDLGVDLVVHSATKYIGGHNDVVAGLLVSAREDLGEQLAFIQNTVGAIPGPQDCWLLLRGLKTLAVRLEWSQRSALRLAEFLAGHPVVKKVMYPGLVDHPGHNLCQKQSRGFGAMLSFEVESKEIAINILERVKLISFAESLGGVESLITYPETQTHASIPVDIRRSLGISDRLLRLSVGLEDPADLEADLIQALKY